MLIYTLRCQRFSEQLIDISLDLDVSAGTVRLFLPHWRPGRYELQNYAILISDVTATDAAGLPLAIKKTHSHGWEVEVPAATTLHVSYTFYANQPDAGGSYLDANQLMINGINCFLCPEGGEETPCQLFLDIPSDFAVSGGLTHEDDHYRFESFHQLVDSPFLAGRALRHHQFDVGDFPVHLWFLGDVNPEIPQLMRDISGYSRTQLALFGECPVDEYHYLYFILPRRFRHGVEHYQSTIIVMGPGRDLMKPDHYRSLLEISSHEFFHTWNVKAMRPAEMWPYDYQQENYSELHFITEGVTTYYGDLMLWKGGVWNFEQWLNSINGELARHYQMGGKDYVSLSEASFDSWVNGYKNDGMPHRRISFYTKGYLVSMLLDFSIRRDTDHEASLDTIMQQLYQSVTAEGRGYTREDFTRLIQLQTDTCYDAFFADYVDGTKDLSSLLEELGAFYGMTLLKLRASSPSEARWGIKTKAEQGRLLVDTLYPGSPLLAAGITAGDELVAINDRQLRNDLDQWLQYFSSEEVLTCHFFHEGKLIHAQVPLRSDYRRETPQFVSRAQLTPTQQANRTAWQQVGTSEIRVKG